MLPNCTGYSYLALNYTTLFIPDIFSFDNETYRACNLSQYYQQPKATPGVVPEPPFYILLCVSIFYIVIFLTGAIGNILVIFVVFRNGEMRTSTNYFLVNLSIADLFVIVICMPTAFIDLHAKDIWYLGAAMCKYMLVFPCENINQKKLLLWCYETALTCQPFVKT